jgi:hypothetical protein
MGRLEKVYFALSEFKYIKIFLQLVKKTAHHWNTLREGWQRKSFMFFL